MPRFRPLCLTLFEELIAEILTNRRAVISQAGKLNKTASRREAVAVELREKRKKQALSLCSPHQTHVTMSYSPRVLNHSVQFHVPANSCRGKLPSVATEQKSDWASQPVWRREKLLVGEVMG